MGNVSRADFPPSSKPVKIQTRFDAWVHSCEMISLLYRKPWVGYSTAFQASLHSFWDHFTCTPFGKNYLEWCWKPCQNSRCVIPTTFYPLARSHLFTGMTQFIPDKATGSIFISLLCSTGLLINRSILLWTVGVSLTGGTFSQVSSSSFLVVHSPSMAHSPR